MKDIISFRHRFVYLPDAGAFNLREATTIAAELMQFGFLLTNEAIAQLSKADKHDLTALANELIPYLKQQTGTTHSYRPFWKGFPQQVMETSESVLWLYQIIHYLSNGEFEPNDWTRNRPSAFEQPAYTVIQAGTEKDLKAVFTRLVGANQSLTPEDQDTIDWFVLSGMELVMPNQIPFKETLCQLAGLGLDVPVKTVTDVLRIAVYLSGGDSSLPAVPPAEIPMSRWNSTLVSNPVRDSFKFLKFGRERRRYLLGLLEKTNLDVREGVLKAGRWVRLGEVLHPGEYATRFPKSAAFFQALRNDKVTSWYGEVDRAFAVDFSQGLHKLAERPGEFIRRLDSLLRNGSSVDAVMSTFQQVAPTVSNKVLLETYTHFAKRKEPFVRKVFIKGARRPVSLPELKPLKRKLVERVQSEILAVIQAKMKDLSPLGPTWIDPELKKIPLPTNMRSLNPALKPTIRGQRVPIGNQQATVIRAFVHWYDSFGNQDIDLTATYIGRKSLTHVGWNGEHNSPYGVYSGDIRHRQGPCAEYIDIHVGNAIRAGYKYVMIDARNYNGGSFAEINDCVFGYMEREFPEANAIFVPETLANTVRLQSESSNTLVALIDLKSREYIFLDIDQQGLPVASLNQASILELTETYIKPPKPSVYDLLSWHVAARGELVSEEKAVRKLTVEQFSTSYVAILQWLGV